MADVSTRACVGESCSRWICLEPIWLGLTEANLSGADLGWVDLTKSNLTEANLVGADLREARLEGANLHLATYNESTIFPIGFCLRRRMRRV